MEPVRMGIIGMGGFAGAHHDAALRLEEQGACRVVCACDLDLGSFAERQEALRFAARGVRTYGDYREMLAAEAGELELVTIPTPVPLHAAMHQAGVERGLAVYLEKPPTLNYAELDAMLEVERGARWATNVGFNHIVEPARQALKAEILSGKYGAVRSVSVYDLSPRGTSYYARAPWAGRLRLDGRLVLDSCVGNARAHLVHDALHWCGPELWAWGEIAAVRAELYRVHAIEGTDTVFAAATTGEGVELRLAATHAVAPPAGISRERIECEQATITWEVAERSEGGHGWAITVAWRDGREEPVRMTEIGSLEENLRAYLGYLRGEAERPMTRLADSRPFVVVNDLMYLAAGRITTVAGEGEGEFVTIPGVAAALEHFAETGEFPSETGVPWATAGGEAPAARLGELEAVVRDLTP